MWAVSDLVFTPQQAVVVVFDAGAYEVHAMVLNPEVKISKPEHHPGTTRKKIKWMKWSNKQGTAPARLRPYPSPVVNDSWGCLRLKFLRVDDVLKFVDSLFGVLHVRGQVAVDEAERVAVERQADRDGSFVALRDTRSEKRALNI